MTIYSVTELQKRRRYVGSFYGSDFRAGEKGMLRLSSVDSGSQSDPGMGFHENGHQLLLPQRVYAEGRHRGIFAVVPV